MVTGAPLFQKGQILGNFSSSNFFYIEAIFDHEKMPKMQISRNLRHFPKKGWGDGRQGKNLFVLEQAAFPEVESPAVVIIG